ncbi:hypothetical protein B0H10DRAFT_1281403 [Mycena sp. CBHHK59/15]|nr:hypothetical protein B0H10DRAFT_1281403 [Mycena sp. CBHHK59/15]
MTGRLIASVELCSALAVGAGEMEGVAHLREDIDDWRSGTMVSAIYSVALLESRAIVYKICLCSDKERLLVRHRVEQ